MTRSAGNNFFDAGSPYLTHPLLTAERTAAEIDEIFSVVGATRGRVVDIGCGFGRHSIELASRGADVTGIDPSQTMIAAARDAAVEAGQFVDFQCTPAGEFTDVARYDLGLCLFTTLGQLGAPTTEDEPHLEVLRRAKRSLRPGAWFVVEVPERERTAEMLVTTETVGTTKVKRAFDKRSSLVRERFVTGSGDVFNLIYRLFAKTELVDLLHDVGFETQHVWDRALVSPPPTFMTVFARCPE